MLVFIVWQDLYNIFCLFVVFFPYIYWQDLYNMFWFISCAVSLYLLENLYNVFLRYLLRCFSVFTVKFVNGIVQGICCAVSLYLLASNLLGKCDWAPSNAAGQVLQQLEVTDVAIWRMWRCGR